MPSPKQKVYVNGMGVIETTFLDLKPKGEVPKDYQTDWDSPCDPLKDITEATEMVKRDTGLISDYPGVAADYDSSGWNAYRAEGNRRLNDLLEFAEKQKLTFKFRRHGSGQHWMIECQGPDPIDGVVEHVFDEKEDLSWPLQMCIDVLKIAQHDATLKQRNEHAKS